MNWLKKFFSFLVKTVVRPGMDVFLDRYMQIAKDVVQNVLESNPDVPFHDIKSDAFRRLKEVTAQQRDTWISILVDLAFESVKAIRASSQNRS